MSQNMLPFGPSLPFDLEDPVDVAATWSSIIEPGDPAARVLLQKLGSTRALTWIFDPVGKLPEELTLPHLNEEGVPEIPWAKCHSRWHPRSREVNVQESRRILKRLGGQLLTPADSNWPSSLGALENKEPLALWVMGEGDLNMLTAPSVSIVGARASTAYGNRVAGELARELTGIGVPVISGGAYGIDASAHRGAIAAAALPGQVGSGIAVVCGGLGNLYPAGNAQLFRNLVKQGLIITEVPPHWRPARWRFLERNRVIAALSLATVIVEAGRRSGALATANRAAEIGRSVGAVPGPVTSGVSVGCHDLIRDGAELITGAADVQDLLEGRPTGSSEAGRKAEPSRVSPHAAAVWSAFPLGKPSKVHQLARTCGLGIAEVEVALLELQLQGLALPESGQWRRAEIN